MTLHDINVNLDRVHYDLHRRKALTARAASEVIGGSKPDLGSDREVNNVLFDALGMPSPPGLSFTAGTCHCSHVGDAELQWLFDKTGHPFLTHLLQYRELQRIEEILADLRGAVLQIKAADE